MTPVQRAILRLLRVPRLPEAPDLPRHRVLAVQIAGMGDLVLAGPALRALAAAAGRGVDLLTSPKGRRAAEGCPHLGRIHALDAGAFANAGGGASTGWGGWDGWRALARLVPAIRRLRYGLAVNLIGLYSPGGAVRMGLLLRALGIPHLAGRDTLGAGTFFHHAIEEDLRAPRNERDANLALAAALGARDPQGGRLEVWPDAAQRRRAGELARELAGKAPGTGPIVGVNPGSDRPEKVWPEANFLGVMRALGEERGARFLLTGGPAEADLTARLARALSPGAVDTVGRIGFQGTAALMERMDLFLTCDTAALHLAWAAGVPAVALFKAENLGRYRPETPLIECLTGREARPADPIDLPPEEVARACLRRLGARRRDPGAGGR